jgi:hypothetical protein
MALDALQAALPDPDVLPPMLMLLLDLTPRFPRLKGVVLKDHV